MAEIPHGALGHPVVVVQPDGAATARVEGLGLSAGHGCSSSSALWALFGSAAACCRTNQWTVGMGTRAECGSSAVGDALARLWGWADNL